MSDAARPATPLARLRAGLSALLALIAADQAVRRLPFAWVAARVRRPIHGVAPEPVRDALVIRWAIGAAAARLPWEVRCLAQAVAANQLLARRDVGSCLWLGVDHDAVEGLVAHAWLEAAGVVVTGRRGRERFTPLHRLANVPAPDPDARHTCSS